MRTRRIMTIGLCCILLAFLNIPYINANVTHVFSFHNKSSSNKGTLKIDLEQYQLDRNGNRVLAQSKSVLPGERVSYIPVIRNDGIDCYIRLKIIIEMEDRDIKRSISLSDLYGIGSEWKQVGEYIYYTPVLKTGASVDAFQGVEIPCIWTQKRHESSGFTLYVYADAIQSDNYTPNYTSRQPWDGETSVQTGDDSMLRYWVTICICLMSVAIYSLWNRRR